MRPYIDDMRDKFANALDIELDQINIKATTEENLGFTGRGEGIAAEAVCMLYTAREMYSMDVTGGGCPAAGSCSACPRNNTGN